LDHLLGPVNIYMISNVIMFKCRLCSTRMNDAVQASLHRLQVEDRCSIIYVVHIALMKYRGKIVC